MRFYLQSTSDNRALWRASVVSDNLTLSPPPVNVGGGGLVLDFALDELRLFGLPMSALGHKRTSLDVHIMSGLPPIADIARRE